MNTLSETGPVQDAILGALQTGEEVEVAAGGISMGGAFGDGARLVVKSADLVRWGCGDVVVYAREGRWIAHRVVWRFPASNGVGAACITKGDGVSGFDRPFVQRGELVGVAVGVIQGGLQFDLAGAVRRLQGVWIIVRGLMVMSVARVFPGRGRRRKCLV